MRSIRVQTALLVLIATVSACATTGSTYHSGVPDTILRHAPWYAGHAMPDSALGYLPILYQRGGSQSAMLDPEAIAGSPVALLLAEMNDYLAAMTTLPRVADAPLPGTPPDVQFGCEADIDGECTNGPAAPFVPGKPQMRLAVGRPSSEWTVAFDGAISNAGVAQAIVITLEVGQYWPVQTNWRGSKAVELGTGNTRDLPWLTSLETPVTVLQLTGAVIGRDGRAVRIGAEGLYAKRTGLVAASFGGQAVLSDEDIEQVRTLRRDDLPGSPLAWQVALQSLVSQLSGGTALRAN